jgi:hypothetical protein
LFRVHYYQRYWSSGQKKIHKMRTISFFGLILLTSAFVSGNESESDDSSYRSSRSVSAYGYAYNPPPTQSPVAVYQPIDNPSCNQCKPTTRCKSELEIRDSDIPKEVPIPSVEYQVVYKDKPVQVVTDFDVRENPRPVPVQLQDEQIVVQPNVRTVEKLVIVRVPRITENVVVKKVDRIKLETEYRTKPKQIRIQHVRQVPDTVKVPQLKDVRKKVLRAEHQQVPIPVRIANQVEVDIQRVDKPVQVPSIQYRFCEHVQEIKIKGDCPTTPAPTKPGYLPPDQVVGHGAVGSGERIYQGVGHGSVGHN